MAGSVGGNGNLAVIIVSISSICNRTITEVIGHFFLAIYVHLGKKIGYEGMKYDCVEVIDIPSKCRQWGQGMPL